MTNYLKGAIAIGLSVLCAASIEVVGSFVLSKGIDPITLLNVRYWIATTLMLGTVLFMKKSFKIKKKDIKHLVLQSALLCAHTIFYWLGIAAMKDVPSALVLHRLYPIWLLLIAYYFLKEKISRVKLLSLTAGMIGALFAVGLLPGLHLVLNTKGTILISITSILYALLLISGKEILKKYNQFTVLFYNFLFTSGVLMLLQAPQTVIGHITPLVLPYMVFMGVVSTYLLYLFNYTGLKYVKASDFILLYQMKPVIGFALAFMLLGQALSGWQWVGAALVMVSMYLLTKEKKHES